MAFIFDPSKGETPESLRKKREIAEALRANAMGMASSPGEGLAMIGAAIGARRADSKANKAAAFGQQQASSAMAPIIAALGGGGSPAPSTPSAQAPTQPASQPAPQAMPVKISGGKAEFINALLPAAVEESKRTGIDPRIIVAQAAQETGWGRSAPGNNFFGIKSHGKGGGQNLTTHEVINGQRVKIKDSFRTFASPADSVRGYGDFMLENPRYKPMRETAGLDAQLAALGASGYATDPKYADSVGAIARGIQIPENLAYTAPQSYTPAAQAVTAMAQGGQSMPQAAPQMAPQPTQGGGAMDVWRGMAQRGVASDGSQLIRTPEGVQRTSTKGYSEIIRPEGKPSDREPMPMRGQGGGIGAVISSLLGRGQPQGAQPMPQQMAQQGMSQAPQPVTDPAAYNAGVVRMSPDLGGPARQPVPQNQPPIPGIQPSPLTMQDMAGRMPAPQGQPMPQGVDALRTALQPQQAAPQPAPAQQAPVASPQAQPAPQTAQVPAGGIALPQLLQIAQNPWVAENKLYGGIINTLIENQLNMNKPMNPMEKAQLEKLLIETEQLRNPVAKPTGDMTEYDLYVEQATAAGQQPMPFLDYQQALKKAGATNVTTNLGEGDKFYENLDKKNAETFSALSETGMQARGKLAQVDRLGALLTAAPQGASAMLKQAAGEYGINTEGLSDIQAAQALINELVPQQRQPGSGPMSDADLALFKQSLPRLINQPEGNRAIIETMRGITQYQIQMGDIADAVSNREMTPAEGRKAIASLENPLAGFGKKMGQFQPAPANLGQGVPSGVDPAVWEVMTPEERALFQ